MNSKESVDGLQVETEISEKVLKSEHQKSLEQFLQSPIKKILLIMDFILYKMSPFELLPAIHECPAKGRLVRPIYSLMFLRNLKSSHP